MAYDPMNVSRLGQVNQAAGVDALFLKVFAGEVLTSFAEKNIMMPLHMVRTIQNGKSASFPVVGKIAAEYHTPGAMILGQKVNHNEKIITIDALLISDAFIADIDEAMNHYEVRSKYTTQMGAVLAKTADRNIFFEVIKAARAATTLTDGNGGTELKNDKFQIGTGGSANLTEQASALAAGLFAAAEAMDEKDIPEDGRYAILRPAEYYALVQNKDVINRDWGGSGAYSDGTVFRVAGINILKSNHLPKLNGAKATYDPAGAANYVANPEYSAYHGVDCGKTVGVVFQTDAVGTVKLMDLSMQSDYMVDRQGTLLVARYAMGHGILRPECAVELKLDSLSNTASTYPA